MKIIVKTELITIEIEDSVIIDKDGYTKRVPNNIETILERAINQVMIYEKTKLTPCKDTNT